MKKHKRSTRFYLYSGNAQGPQPITVHGTKILMRAFKDVIRTLTDCRMGIMRTPSPYNLSHRRVRLSEPVGGIKAS